MHNLEDFMFQEQAYFDVFCDTDSCENNNIELRVIATLENPQVMCGACGEWIANITILPQDYVS